MLTVIMIALLVSAGLVVWAVVTAARSNATQVDHDPKASDLHGSNANFGNSLQGDNSNFGRGFYDE